MLLGTRCTMMSVLKSPSLPLLFSRAIKAKHSRSPCTKTRSYSSYPSPRQTLHLRPNTSSQNGSTKRCRLTAETTWHCAPNRTPPNCLIPSEQKHRSLSVLTDLCCAVGKWKRIVLEGGTSALFSERNGERW